MRPLLAIDGPPHPEEKRLEEDDEDEPELVDPEDSDDPSEPAQLTGRVPRVHPSSSRPLYCVDQQSRPVCVGALRFHVL